MGYQLWFSDEARLDVLDAFSWYEAQREGLGKDFELCLEAGLNALQRTPFSFRQKHKAIRVYYIARFPYGIHYVIQKREILVLAVFHTSRNPQSWKGRLNP